MTTTRRQPTDDRAQPDDRPDADALPGFRTALDLLREAGGDA